MLPSTVAATLDDAQAPPGVPPAELNCRVEPLQTVFPPVIVPALKAADTVATIAVLEEEVQPPILAST